MAMLFKDTGPLPKGQLGPAGPGLVAERGAPVQGAEMEIDQPLAGKGTERKVQTIETQTPTVDPTGGEVSKFQGKTEWAGALDVDRDNGRRTRILCTVNRKGGVGKTTTTFNLAGALAQMGKQVLVIDMDPMGSLCRSLGIYPDQQALSDLLVGTGGSLGDLIRPTHLTNLYVIPGDPNLRTFEMRHGTSVVYREALSKQLNEVLQSTPYDFVFIDCPPSLGLISGNAMTAATEAIVPVDGSTYGMGALMDTLGILRLVRKNVNTRLSVAGLLLNNVNLGTVYDRTVLEVFRRKLRKAMFNAVIPTSPEADESSQLGEPVTRHAPSSWMSKAYWQLAKEILSQEPSYAA